MITAEFTCLLTNRESIYSRQCNFLFYLLFILYRLFLYSLVGIPVAFIVKRSSPFCRGRYTKLRCNCRHRRRLLEMTVGARFPSLHFSPFSSPLFILSIFASLLCFPTLPSRSFTPSPVALSSLSPSPCHFPFPVTLSLP